MTLETFSPGQKLRQETAKACRSFPENDKGVPRESTGPTYCARRSSGDVEEGFTLPAVLRALREPSPKPRLFGPGSHRRIMPSYDEG